MDFIKKIEFIISRLECYDNIFQKPLTKHLHEKAILCAKEILYNNDVISPFIVVHAATGFFPFIVEFPYAEIDRNKYIEDLKNYISDLGSTGYSVVLAGNELKFNHHHPKYLLEDQDLYNEINAKNIVEIMTEDQWKYKIKTRYLITQKIFREKKRLCLSDRKNFYSFNGRFSGLVTKVNEKD